MKMCCNWRRLSVSSRACDIGKSRNGYAASCIHSWIFLFIGRAALPCRPIGHAFMPDEREKERDRTRFFLNRKKPSEGANRVTELRDRIKTASVCPPLWRLPSRNTRRFYRNSRYKFKLWGTIICTIIFLRFSLFLLFYSWSSLVLQFNFLIPHSQ